MRDGHPNLVQEMLIGVLDVKKARIGIDKK